MKSQRQALLYVVSFLSVLITYAGLLIALSMYFEPVEGDLTRLGNWAERDFGWRHPEPIVPLKNNGNLVQRPEVLVLGDSFSRSNAWQSFVEQKRNIEILSFHYQDVGCLDNWLRWVAEKRYPTVKTVVIETIEREFMMHFGDIERCPSSAPSAFKIESEIMQPRRKQLELTKDIWYFARVAENSARMKEQAGRIETPKVINVPLRTGSFFSNRRSDRLLYYRMDEVKQEWSATQFSAAIANVTKIRDDLGKVGLHLVVIVVPDKSSVYRPYFAVSETDASYPDIYAALEKAGVTSVDLLAYFRTQIQTTVDLYRPNDTHLSVKGFKAMAEKIADSL